MSIQRPKARDKPVCISFLAVKSFHYIRRK